MSTFPSILSVISDPTATNKLNSPSHSSIEQAQNDGIKKLETFIGTLASAAGTLMYDVRSADSNGGGHVQAANKGGTGQTTFTKGDILVSTSASVLSKLAVGSNEQALLADSAQAAGVKWGGVATATQIQNQAYSYARASVISGSVYGVVLGQAVSILSDGLGLVVKFPAANATSLVSLQVNATGPSSLTALVKDTLGNNLRVAAIQPSMIGVVAFDSVSSVFQMLNTEPTPIAVHKSADETVNNSDVLQNDDQLLFAVAVNKNYLVEMVLILETGTTSDFKWDWALPAGGTFFGEYFTGSTTKAGVNVTEAGDAAAVMPSATTVATIRGIMKIGATAGTAQFRWAQATAESFNTKILAGSVIRYDLLN